MKIILLTIILTISIGVIVNAQQTNQPKYGKSQESWNKTLKKDWFNHQPNQLLVETIEDINPGTALDVATGEGRNAIFLAQKGWKVTGFDIANEALDSIQERAKLLNLKINTVHASREDFDFGINKWDLVVLCFVDIICNGCIANDDFIPTIAKSLKKGGLVVYEMGHRDFYLENWEKPGKWGCTEEQLTDAFGKEGFEILRCEGVTETGDWGGDKPGKKLKFVAKKL
ncbi:MAG: class I SAM-dependent methyltransferase [Mariniphaga sp.]|nr:class I SAM-dependent methyltransferase [Mariniphaga sp.]